MLFCCFTACALAKTGLAAVSYVDRATAGCRVKGDLSAGWEMHGSLELGKPVDNCWCGKEELGTLEKMRIDYSINNSRKRGIFVYGDNKFESEDGMTFVVKEGVKLCHEEEGAVLLNSIEVYKNDSRLLTSDDLDPERVITKDNISLDGDRLLTEASLSSMFDGEPTVGKAIAVERMEGGSFQVKDEGDLRLILDLGAMWVKGVYYSSDSVELDNNFTHEWCEYCEDTSHCWKYTDDVLMCMSSNGTLYPPNAYRDLSIEGVSVQLKHRDNVDSRQLLSEESVRWMVEKRADLLGLAVDGKVDMSRLTKEVKEEYEDGEVLEGKGVLGLLSNYRQKKDLLVEDWVSMEMEQVEDSEGWLFFLANTSQIADGDPVRATFEIEGEKVAIEGKRNGEDIYNKGNSIGKGDFQFYITSRDGKEAFAVKKEKKDTTLLKVEYKKGETYLATLKDLEGVKVDVDLGGYYTKAEVDKKLAGDYVEYISKEEGKCFKGNHSNSCWFLENPPDAKTYILNITFNGYEGATLKESVVVEDGKVKSTLNVDKDPRFYRFDPDGFSFYIDANSDYTNFSSTDNTKSACIDVMYYGEEKGYYNKEEVDRKVTYLDSKIAGIEQGDYVETGNIIKADDTATVAGDDKLYSSKYVSSHFARESTDSKGKANNVLREGNVVREGEEEFKVPSLALLNSKFKLLSGSNFSSSSSDGTTAYTTRLPSGLEGRFIMFDVGVTEGSQVELKTFVYSGVYTEGIHLEEDGISLDIQSDGGGNLVLSPTAYHYCIINYFLII